MKKLNRLFSVAVLGLITVIGAACSAAPIAKDATYRTLDDLIGAVQSTGLKCEGDVQKFTDGSSEYRTCGMHGWAAIYGTASARDRQVKIQSGSPDSVMVVGPNWVVKAPMGDAEAVKEKLGGTVHE